MSKTKNTIEDLLKKQQNENRLLHEENDKFQKV